MNYNPIIVALDLDSAAEARNLVKRLGPPSNFYKVGMELYAAAGMNVVQELLDAGKDVFLDLKLYDIPETVKRAVAVVARTRVRFLTIHAVGSVMRAAMEGSHGSSLRLLAVTVLTSFGPADLLELGYDCPAADLVRTRTVQAMDAGIRGIVTSPREASLVRSVTGPDAVIVTPGVRSAGRDAGDQQRISTPPESLRAGADYLVMGRQITRANDPAAEFARVQEEIGQVQKMRA
jgi:orotidine-5'-phosphate decarboxylase